MLKHLKGPLLEAVFRSRCLRRKKSPRAVKNTSGFQVEPCEFCRICVSLGIAGTGSRSTSADMISGDQFSKRNFTSKQLRKWSCLRRKKSEDCCFDGQAPDIEGYTNQPFEVVQEHRPWSERSEFGDGPFTQWHPQLGPWRSAKDAPIK